MYGTSTFLFVCSIVPALTSPAKVYKRHAAKPERLRWTDNTIPYLFKEGVFSDAEIQTIKDAMEEWSNHTCINFREAGDGDTHKIIFVDGKECSSFIGMISPKHYPTPEGSPVILGKRCRSRSTVLHELGHAIGLYHVQNRPDRDQHITLDLGDVNSDLLPNFDTIPVDEIHDYGVKYDFKSVMHYGPDDFHEDVIATIDHSKMELIGNAPSLSFGDIKIVNRMYKCSAFRCRRKKSEMCKEPGFLDESCECMCPGPSYAEPTVPCKGATESTATTSEASVTTSTIRATTAEATTTSSTTNVETPSTTAWWETATPTYDWWENEKTSPATYVEGFTNTYESSCFDIVEDCRYWKTWGFCQYNRDSAQEVCPKSCNFCAQNDRCTDKAQGCFDLVYVGLCREPFVADLCRASCGYC